MNIKLAILKNETERERKKTEEMKTTLETKWVWLKLQ